MISGLCHPAGVSVLDRIQDRLAGLHSGGLYRRMSILQGAAFLDNDYLGLSLHPAIREAGKKALAQGRLGSRGSRLLGGHSEIFEALETKIATFFKSPQALFFSTGYLANLSIVQALSEVVDHIVSDEKNHASLIDAIRLSGTPKTIQPHQQWDVTPDLRRQSCLFITESLFSMDGDVADLPTLEKLTASGDHFLLVDEAHAAGVFEEEGRGRVISSSTNWNQLAVTVTFGKAFGIAGAAILCSPEVKELVVNRARAFIYTTAPSPVVAAMVGASLDVVREESWRRRELWDRAREVRSFFHRSEITGYESGAGMGIEPRSPILPVLIPGEDRALRFCETMRESGFELKAIRYPTVPRGTERVRISLNLEASRDATQRMAKEVVKRWKGFS
jgi:8-amino-7-oxononanoate synthase